MSKHTEAPIDERRDALGNLIDPNNSWRPGSPWWFETNALYTKWRARHAVALAQASGQ